MATMTEAERAKAIAELKADYAELVGRYGHVMTIGGLVLLLPLFVISQTVRSIFKPLRRKPQEETPPNADRHRS